jgi:elongation factor Ts
MIVTQVSADGKTGVVVEVNCETDFVGRSDDFVAFAGAVAATIAARKPKTLEELRTLKAPGGKSIADLTNDLLAKVGEKIDVRRFTVLDSPDGAVFSYTHLGSKIGVLVECLNLAADAAGTVVGRDVAMQIAAMNPMTVGRESIPRETVEKELDIYRTQAKNEGKPAPIVEKIANGRLEKFYQEVCLLEQIFVKDGGKTIRDYLAETGKGTTVKQFHRYHLGEEGR